MHPALAVASHPLPTQDAGGPREPPSFTCLDVLRIQILCSLWWVALACPAPYMGLEEEAGMACNIPPAPTRLQPLSCPTVLPSQEDAFTCTIFGVGYCPRLNPRSRDRRGHEAELVGTDRGVGKLRLQLAGGCMSSEGTIRSVGGSQD